MPVKNGALSDLGTFPLVHIEKCIRDALIIYNGEIDAVLDYILKSSGKMLRPRLVHTAASIGQYNEKVLHDIAAAVELIHMASLVHDDVIDEATTRRGKASANSVFGNKVSVLAGDYLFAAAFKLINKHNQPQIMKCMTETIQVMCLGEIKQLSMLHNIEITEEDYYDKTYRKTACLFASSCKVGAILSFASLRDISVLEQYGLSLGYAYQLIDDVLDFVSQTEVLGKPVGNDLLQGNITLPVILSLKNRRYGKKIEKIIREGVSLQNLPFIIELIDKAGGIEKTLQKAKDFLHNALNVLDELPASAAVDRLRNFGLYLIEDYYRYMEVKNDILEGYACRLQLK